MKQDLKLRLEYSFCEALVYDVEERIGLGMYEPEDKLLFAVLHEFIMQVKRKMLVYQKQYVTKVKATHALAMQDYYIKYIATYTEYYGVQLMQLSNQINQHYA